MSNITLSAAVRSNLLSLQNTASLLDTTQTRLATGNKVNSALDNPTSYFTAASLNSRASDLGNLLDSVSNAVQTIQAANDGISSITKLVDSAKATANQAQQLSETITSTGAATAGTVTAGAFTTLDVSGTASSATAGTVTAGAFTTVNVSGAGSAANAATLTQGTYTPIDLSAANTLTFDLTVDGSTTSISLDNTITAVDNTAVTGAELATAINAAVGSSVASFNGTELVFTSTTTGTSSNLTVANVAGTAAVNSGVTAGTDTGAAAVAADQLSFTLNVDGAGAQTININATTVAAAPGGLNAASLSAADIAAVINDQFGSTVASVVSGALTFTSGTTGASSSVATSAVTATGSATNTTGIAAGSNTGSAAATADSVSFTVAVDGGSAQTVTLSAAAVTAYNAATSSSLVASSLSAANVAAIANNQLGANIASVVSGALTFASTTTGASSSVAVSAVTNAGTPTGSTGVAAATNTGAASSTTSIANPARAALITQYNSLLDQIDQLASDSGYNGNNLLAGTSTTLKVVFNETGSSSLTIAGKDATATGLGLSKLTAGTEFNTNASITTLLGTLKSATDTLRADASSFGSNLSIVQTRQDFTKAIINTLQTGASNLTLADSNEEAANLLALQTRQSLSTKALSLASQSDQNVLRLLQ